MITGCFLCPTQQIIRTGAITLGNDDPLDLGVWRNGKRRDLQADAGSLYRSPVINSAWGSGVLEVNVAGEAFRCEVDADGKVSFK